MATKEEKTPPPTPNPMWMDFRDGPEGGFGSRQVEFQVVQAAAAPSSRAIKVADGTPVSDWAPWTGSVTPGVTAG